MTTVEHMESEEKNRNLCVRFDWHGKFNVCDGCRIALFLPIHCQICLFLFAREISGLDLKNLKFLLEFA